jgi:serine/threonine-protein kinase
VHHPNVVQISDFGQLPDGVPYFVMELLVGHTLGEVIKAGGPIPAARAVRIAKQVANGLGAAHAAGVIHRDMKPENVFLVGGAAMESADVGRSRAMLGERVDVRVVDFGAAKVIGSGRMTRTGIVFGTPHYMSPEQASGGPVDHRADIYALGIIMYEMFTGRVPFEADTYMGILTQHMFVQPLPPSQVSDAARELGALEEVTLRCLEKRPEGRYASMDDLVASIDAAAFLREDGQLEIASRSSSRPSRRPSSRPPGLMADELEPPTLEEARARARKPPDHGVRAAVAIAGALVVAAILATALLRRREDAKAQEATTLASTATATATPTATPTATATPTLTPTPTPTAISARPPLPNPSDSSDTATASVVRPVTRRPPAHRPVSRDIDDVGDPFATPVTNRAAK